MDVAHLGNLLLRLVTVVLRHVLLLVEEVLELSLLHQLLLALHRRLILDGLLVLIISDHLHVHAHLLLLLAEELLEDHLRLLALLSVRRGELASLLLLVEVGHFG